MDIIASPTGRTHVKSDVGMWPSCRYDAWYGNRLITYKIVTGNVTCRRCRQSHELIVPGEREAIPNWSGGRRRGAPRSRRRSSGEGHK